MSDKFPVEFQKICSSSMIVFATFWFSIYKSYQKRFKSNKINRIIIVSIFFCELAVLFTDLSDKVKNSHNIMMSLSWFLLIFTCGECLWSRILLVWILCWRILDTLVWSWFGFDKWMIFQFILVSLNSVLVISHLIIFARHHFSGYSELSNEELQQNHKKLEKWIKVFRYLWPRSSIKLQLMFCFSVMMLVLGRIVNVLVPLQYKLIVDDLTASSWKPLTIVVYVILRFLQGGVGLISSVQNWTWIPVGQYTTREVGVSAFAHLHSLSMQFHLTRKTGEVLRVMDRGTSSIVSLLNSLVFNIIPTLVDVIVACFFFLFQFNGWFALIVLFTMASYIGVTVLITEWRIQFRRLTNELENKASQQAVDSLLNFETVKYYGAEKYEVGRYRSAIESFQSADWKSQASLNILNLGQNFVITFGLVAGSLLIAYRVAQGIETVGSFVLFMTYLIQLYTPLNFLGTYYRIIQQNLIDMENMVQLMEHEPDVVDTCDSTDLKVAEGKVEFENVSFEYQKDCPVLNKVSFVVPPGQTLALVGESGGGKSTILRLLFRFYDIQQGRILVDGKDIRSIKMSSLRNAIGVVPQDTVLFNDTIYYNIRYGKIDATDSDVEEAAKSAQIHSRILSFPQQYQTIVGERGLRLSGGEKQRVAIARTLLKNPPIVVLDESTSALDTTTERSIQEELFKITRTRTTIVIAHRLSTIIHANTILVMDKGRIAEQGSHSSLLEKKGIYYDLWNKQITK